jgi:hypothetical protein
MGQYTDTYHGVVLDNADPEGTGRVLVQVPEVGGGVSAWAKPLHAGASAPEIGAGVSVRYEDGDESHPLWSTGGDAAGGHYSGTYRGTVVNNVDPAGYGRLEVQVPEVLGTGSAWATPEQAPPQVGTEVWVRFVDGDPQHPVWTV